EQIYADAWNQINKRNWEEASKQFNEVDRQHPYSVWARRAMLMSAFCSYQANKYGDAVSTADQYISLHPGSHEVAYAFYLKAISLYEQIVDVNRDQANTQGALDVHDLLIERDRLQIESIGDFMAAGMQRNILVGGGNRVAIFVGLVGAEG